MTSIGGRDACTAPSRRVASTRRAIISPRLECHRFARAIYPTRRSPRSSSSRSWEKSCHLRSSAYSSPRPTEHALHSPFVRLRRPDVRACRGHYGPSIRTGRVAHEHTRPITDIPTSPATVTPAATRLHAEQGRPVRRARHIFTARRWLGTRPRSDSSGNRTAGPGRG